MLRKTRNAVVSNCVLIGIALFLSCTEAVAVPEEWQEALKNAGVYTNSIPEADLKAVLGDIDMMGLRTAVIYRRAVNSGAALHPFLAQVLRGDLSAMAAGRILAIFVESEGDKTVALGAIRALLPESQGPGKEKARLRRAIANALGKLGKPSDCASLYSWIDDSDLIVRVRAANALGRLGDKSDIEKIRTIIAQRIADNTAGDMKEDSTVKALEASINAIRERMADKQ